MSRIEQAAWAIRKAWEAGTLARDAKPTDAPPDIQLAWDVATWREQGHAMPRRSASDFIDMIEAGLLDPRAGAGPYIDQDEQAAFHEAVRYVLDRGTWKA